VTRTFDLLGGNAGEISLFGVFALKRNAAEAGKLPNEEQVIPKNEIL
jgi:hypothetical protein